MVPVAVIAVVVAVAVAVAVVVAAMVVVVVAATVVVADVVKVSVRGAWGVRMGEQAVRVVCEWMVGV